MARSESSPRPDHAPGIQTCSSRGSSFGRFDLSMRVPRIVSPCGEYFVWSAHAICESAARSVRRRSKCARAGPEETMASRQRGADALVRAMTNAGVHRVFTLSGNHIMPVFDAAIDAGIALVHTRHEAAAVHMADAWARLTGEPGIALVTGGPGHANAVGALY